MKKIMNAAIVALMLGCTPAIDDRDRPVKAMFLGDSITRDAVIPSFARQIEERHPAGDILVHTSGGYTTRGFLPGSPLYERANVPENRPEIAFVLLGTNDAFNRFSAAEYGRNLQRLTAQLLEDGVGKIVLINPPQVFVVSPTIRPRQLLLRRYVDEVHALCSNPDDRIECGPVLFHLMKKEHFSDGVHPNEAGQALILDALCNPSLGYEGICEP